MVFFAPILCQAVDGFKVRDQRVVLGCYKTVQSGLTPDRTLVSRALLSALASEAKQLLTLVKRGFKEANFGF